MQKFFSGNKDVDRLILEKLNDKDLLKTCKLGKYALELCDENFFRKRLMKDYPDSVKYKNDKSWKNYYLSTIYYVSKMKEEYNFVYKSGDPKEYWNMLNFKGYVALLFELIGKNKAKDLYEIKIINYPALVNTAFAIHGAARNNHKDFIDYLLSQKENQFILNKGLEGATEDNNIELIEFFINKGANSFNESLNIASIQGNINLIEFFINKGVDDLNQAMAQAAKENRKETVNYLIDKGADDYLLAMVGAAQGGNLDMMEDLINKAEGIQVTDFFLSNVVSRAADDGKNGLIKTVKGEKKYDEVKILIENLNKKLFRK